MLGGGAGSVVVVVVAGAGVGAGSALEPVARARSSTWQEGGESYFCRWATTTYELGPSTKQGLGPRAVTDTHVVDMHQV